MQPSAGRKLGEFVLGDELGAGGFGQVYLARQEGLDREAVIKIARSEGGLEASAVERFLAEARLASRIDHPYAAHVYAYGAEPDGVVWIAMERVRGTPLDVVLRTAGPMPTARAIPFLERLCEVVQSAHDQGIVHRDLKPGNVMVIERAGTLLPKLLDLGIARDLFAGTKPDPSALTGTSAASAQLVEGTLRSRGGAVGSDSGARAVGTPLYMAPELWVAAHKAGPAADIYALGAVAFEVLTGAPPFTGATARELATKHARQAPPTLPPSFPPTLSATLQMALAKRAPDRHASAAVFARRLRESISVVHETIGMPALDPAIGEHAMLHAPRPVAEAIAELGSARDVDELIARVWDVERAIAQLLGTYALAARRRIGAGTETESSEVLRLLQRLQQGGLDARAWWQLTRELCRPFARVREAHPLPALVSLWFEDLIEIRSGLDALHDSHAKQPGPSAGDAVKHAFAASCLSGLTKTLVGLRDVFGWRIAVVRTTSQADLLTGLRRPRPQVLAGRWDPGAVGHVVLLDDEETVLLDLEPLATLAAPMPSAPEELFLVEGQGSTGPILRALPGTLLHGVADLWQRAALAQLTDATAAASAAASVPPFRGLSTFRPEDASLFFGRERDVLALVNRLNVAGWIAIVGPSGAGKSSLIQAGVLPALGPTWHAIVVRPGATPIAALATKLGAPDLTAEALTQTPELVADLLERSAASGTSTVLVIDQFEELFTLCLDEVAQSAYARALVAATTRPHVRVVITLRDDFLARAAQVPALRAALSTNLQLVTTPHEDDLVRILVEPARRYGFEFEDPTLVSEMVGEVRNQPAALALLSFTALQLWQMRDRDLRTLTRRAYRAIGGVGGALAQHAEHTLASLAPHERDIVRELFRHLVTADGTRATLSRDELTQVAGGAAAEPGLEAMIQARLLVAMEQPGGETIEVVHETLLSAWPRMVRWRQEDAEHARMRDQLRAAARAWDDKHRSRALLWRGDVLTEYTIWRTRYRGGLTHLEQAFAAASTADARRGRRLRNGLFATLIAALVVTVVVFARLRSTAQASETAALASRAQAEASEAKVTAQLLASYVEQGRQALLAGDNVRAYDALSKAWAAGVRDDAVAFMRARAGQPREAKTRDLDAHRVPITMVSTSPDGRRVLTSAADGRASIWPLDGEGPPIALVANDGPARTVSGWLDDHRVLTVGGASIRVFDADTGNLVHAFAPSPGVTIDTAIAAQTGDFAWSLTSGGLGYVASGKDFTLTEVPLPIPGYTLTAASQDGRWIAFGVGTSDSRPSNILLIDREAGKRHVVDGQQSDVFRLAFSPQSTHFVSVGWDKSVRVWHLPELTKIELHGHTGDVFWADFHPTDERLLVSCGGDSTGRIWNLTDQTSIELRGHAGLVRKCGFSPDGESVFTESSDATARLWDARNGTLQQIVPHGAAVRSSSFLPDGSLYLTGGADGRVSLWKRDRPGAKGYAARAFKAVIAPVVVDQGQLVTGIGKTAIEFMATDRQAARQVLDLGAQAAVARAIPGTRDVLIGTDDGMLLLVAERGIRGRLRLGPTPVTALTATTTTAIVAGRDGGLVSVDIASMTVRNRIATGYSGIKLQEPRGRELWLSAMRADGGRVLATLGLETLTLREYPLEVSSEMVAISLDGSLVANASIVTEVRVLSGQDGSLLARVPLSGVVTSLNWSRDGRTLWVGQSDGVISAIDAKALTKSFEITGQYASVYSISEMPDRNLLATCGADGALRMWDVGRRLEIWKADAITCADVMANDRGLFTIGAESVTWWDTGD